MKKLFFIPVTRSEFVKLPMNIRRRALKEMAMDNHWVRVINGGKRKPKIRENPFD